MCVRSNSISNVHDIHVSNFAHNSYDGLMACVNMLCTINAVQCQKEKVRNLQPTLVRTQMECDKVFLLCCIVYFYRAVLCIACAIRRV